MKRSILLTIILIFCLSNNLYGNEPKMVLIPAGKFNINVSTRYIHLEEYYIDKTEVTQKEYRNIMGNNHFFFKGDNHPAEQISW